MHVVARRTDAERAAHRLEVLAVGLHLPLRVIRQLCVGGADGARDLDPVPAGPGDLERRQHEVGQDLADARDLELGQGEPVAALGRQHHVHQVASAALLDEVALGGRHHLGGGLARRVVLEEDLEPALVDAHRLAHGLELGIALGRARVVELDVEVDEVEALEGAVVAHGHDVVEPVHADRASSRPPSRASRSPRRACPRRPARSRRSRALRRSAPRVGKTMIGSPSAGRTT